MIPTSMYTPENMNPRRFPTVKFDTRPSQVKIESHSPKPSDNTETTELQQPRYVIVTSVPGNQQGSRSTPINIVVRSPSRQHNETGTEDIEDDDEDTTPSKRSRTDVEPWNS